MELLHYLALLRKWFWLILLGTALSGAIAFVVSRQQPPVYRATTTLLISGNSNDVISDYRAILAAENLIPTYAQQLTSRSVQEAVMAQLDLPHWTAKVTTQAVADTQLLQLHVEDTNPEQAARIANLIPMVFVQQEEVIQQQRLGGAEETLAAQLTAVQADIDATYAAITALQTSDNPNSVELQRLQNQLYELQATQSTFTHSYQEVRLAQVQIFDPILVNETAVPPTTPIGPRILQNTLLAAAVGAMLAVGIAFFVEYLDNSVRTPEAIHALMGQNAIGVIPQYQEKENKRRDIITAAQPHSVAAEAYRVLRTNVQLRTLDHPLHTILVTSSLPAEGKSHTVANLGAVIAQADLPVILVDTDLRKPTLHHLFNLKNDKGLTTALLAPDDALSNHVQQTSIKNVRVLTSGPTPPNPAEIIGSERMKALIAKLQQETAVVIFDSPPLLSVADASLLAHQVDGTLLVVGAGMIRPDTLAHAVESLQAIDANLLGVTLTKFNPATAESYYYAAYNEAPALNGRFI